MTKQEIAEMIAKYAITDNRDGRIKISNTKIVTDAIYKQIISVKPEILAYFADDAPSISAAARRLKKSPVLRSCAPPVPRGKHGAPRCGVLWSVERVVIRQLRSLTKLLLQKSIPLLSLP